MGMEFRPYYFAREWVKIPVLHGILTGFDKNPVFDWSRVVFLTAADIPGRNFVHIVRDDYPVLTEKRVTYVTEVLALIAAPDEPTLRAALAAVRPRIDPLPAALTMEEGLENRMNT